MKSFFTFFFTFCVACSFAQPDYKTIENPIPDVFKISGICHTADGTKSILGGENGQLHIYENGIWTIEQFDEASSITVIAEDDDGNLWFLTSNETIVRYDYTSFEIFSDFDNGPISEYISDMKVKNNTIYLSHYTGVSIFTPGGAVEKYEVIVDGSSSLVWDLEIVENYVVAMTSDHIVKIQDGVLDTFSKTSIFDANEFGSVKNRVYNVDGRVFVNSDKNLGEIVFMDQTATGSTVQEIFSLSSLNMFVFYSADEFWQRSDNLVEYNQGNVNDYSVDEFVGIQKYRLSIDQLGQLWVPSPDGNIYLLNPAKANNTVDQSKMQLNIVPNPACDEIVITSNVEIKGSFRIVDGLGATVIKSEFENSNKKIDVSSLESGVYFLMMSDSQGTTVSQKLVVYN